MTFSPEMKDTSIDKPSQDVFVETFSEKLADEMSPVERQKVATELYNVLFGLHLADFSDKQFSLFFMLMHSKNPEQSTEIFNEIAASFPQTWGYLKNLYEHKMIAPNASKKADAAAGQQNLFPPVFEWVHQEKIHILKNIQATLFDVFSVPWSYDIFQKAVREWYMDYIQKKSHTTDEYLQKDVSMLKYDPLAGEMLLWLKSPQEFYVFDEKYMPSLRLFLRKWLEYNFKLLNYTFPTIGTPMVKPAIPKEKPKDTPQTKLVMSAIKEKLHPRYTRDTYDGIQKEKVKNLVTTEEGNIFIWSNDNLGKSHLIQAVLKKLEEEWSEKKIIYTTGNKLYKEIQNRFADDRKELTRAKKERIPQFIAAFAGVDTLIIDDVDAISSWSKSTHDVINQLHTFQGVQIVMLSKFSPAQIQRHTKYVLQEGGWDIIPVSLAEKFSPLLIEMPPVDKIIRKKIAQDIWDKNALPNLFFTPELVSWIINFMSEHISPRIYQQLIKSIMINTEWNEKDISQKMYDIIENMTGEIILPQKDEIVDVIVEEFNLDDIKKYFNISQMTGWMYVDLQKKNLYTEKRVVSDSIEWVALRLCIYFIKKYYPKESLETIGEKFNRSNASSLYKEAKDRLKDEKQLENFLDGQIKNFLKKKYWLQHNI